MSFVVWRYMHKSVLLYLWRNFSFLRAVNVIMPGVIRVGGGRLTELKVHA